MVFLADGLLAGEPQRPTADADAVAAPLTAQRTVIILAAVFGSGDGNPGDLGNSLQGSP